jgi:hypothetical protein
MRLKIIILPLSLLFLLLVGLILTIKGQTASEITKKDYSSDKLSFSYPSTWIITDKSSKTVQQLNLVPEGGKSLILVIAYRNKVSDQSEFYQLKESITKPYVEKISSRFSSSNKTEICTKINNSSIPGYRISGKYDDRESLSDVFSFVMGEKFINLVYLRTIEEGLKSDKVWDFICETLITKNKNSENLIPTIIDLENDAVINSKAKKLPKPEWIFVPEVALKANRGYTITIAIRVLIDENGDVISAKAVEGDLRYFPAAIKAAKEAKFGQFLVCGKPGKHSGILTYNFVHER